MNNRCKCKTDSDRPAVVAVQTTEGLKGLADVIAYVVSTNTTYYINDCHEITILNSGPVFVQSYDAVKNPLGLRCQIAYDFDRNIAIVFAPDGSFRTYKLEGGNNE